MKLFKKPKSRFYWFDFTVRGQFTPVLAMKLVPAIEPRYPTDIPSAGKLERFASTLLLLK